MLRNMTIQFSLAAIGATCVLMLTATATAQDRDEGELGEIQVLAKRVNARNRIDTPAPTLSYDEEYFQRFEPLSVGEMMKRVPGVTFDSDIGEYAEPSLRGLGAGYTQILINGRRVTGSANDNTVFVDRIPAELVERVEIIRSPSSDMDSQGIGGTLNIILKEGAELSGGVYRVGAFSIDGETRPSAFLSFGDTSETLQWGTSLNYQKRFNRKAATEVERAFDGEGGAEPEFAAVIESPDERDSQDIAWTGDLTFLLGENRELGFNAFFMDTDREELEIGREWEAADDDGELDAGVVQTQQSDDFTERNWGLTGTFETGFGAGHSWEFSAGYDKTDFTATETNWEVDRDDFDFASVGITTPEDITTFLGNSNGGVIDALVANTPLLPDSITTLDNLDAQEQTEGTDDEVKAAAKVQWKLGGGSLGLGIEGIMKSRDFRFQAFEAEDGVLEPTDELFSLFDVDDERLNGFLKWSRDFGEDHTLELGVRGENTELDVQATVSDPIADAAADLAGIGLVIEGNQINVSKSYFELNPSAHYSWDMTDRLQLKLSAARTVRRPAFNELNPTLLIDGDESILGNPNLDQETAVGFDIGIDSALSGRDAIVGVNAFYRRVEDKIEVNGVGDEVNAVFQAAIDEEIEAVQYVNNPNKGEIWGVEFDLSYPLAFLPNFHVFANYTWIDSEILDGNANFPVERRFSLQPDYIYNVGFDHLIEGWTLTWGASYQKRGPSEEWVDSGAESKEVNEVTFEGNLEVFVEKTLFDRFVIRLAAQNLLDARKDETARVYGSVDQLLAGTPEAVVAASEQSDPSYILTFRGAF